MAKRTGQANNKYTHGGFSINRIQSVIYGNPEVFVADNTLDAATFTMLFGVPFPDINTATFDITIASVDARRSSVRTLARQINKHMRDQGLYVKTKNKYTSVEILNKSNTEKEVTRYENAQPMYNRCEHKLRHGVAVARAAGLWEAKVDKSDW